MDERPLILDPAVEADAARLAELRAGDAVWREDDTLAVQLRDLMDARSPAVDLAADVLDARAADLLAGAPLDRWGRWVHYPWSGRLVHLLPPGEFRELRLDRNRYKITSAEADRLATIKVGIAGLSVGNSVALTLALEGAFGTLQLADHDRLDLSNMNRIRAPVHEVGVRKTELAARQIWEIDPYARVQLMHDGVTPDNVDAFLVGLDIVVDECDSLYMKFLIRERARERRLPVLMETSDRGMLDVERFDLYPDLPLFHGLTGGLTAEDVRRMDGKDPATRERRAGILLRIVDPALMSTRLAASMLEVDRSISTWPQLASDVILGGASVAVAVRRLALGLPLPSGRRYVDLQRIISEPAGIPEPPGDDSVRPGALPALGSAHPDRADDVPELARYLVDHAALAPSGGNVQPWHFHWTSGPDRLWIVHDRERSRNVLDGQCHASLLALGAAAENASLAAAALGRAATVVPFPGPGVIAIVELAADGESAGSAVAAAALLRLVAQRRTDRRIGPRVPLTDGDIAGLHTSATDHGARLELVTDADALTDLGQVIGAADRLRFLTPRLHREVVGELRWTDDQAQASRDGITVTSLGLGPGTAASIPIVARPDVARVLHVNDLGSRLADGARDALAAASAVGLLSVADDDPAAWFAGGRAMQRVWLAATAQGLAFQPMTALLFMLEMLRDERASVFDAPRRTQLARLEDRLYSVMAPPPKPGISALLFRVARVEGEAERSLRLPTSWVLSSGPPPEATS